MPVDEDARAAIAGMPLGQQILIDGVKLLGVGGTRRGRLSPNGFLSRMQQRIDDLCNGGSHVIFVQIAPTGVA